MFVFGVDVPLVELLAFLIIVSIILLVEIIVVVILQVYQLRQSKKLSRNTLEIARTLLQLKDRELKLRELRK